MNHENDGMMTRRPETESSWERLAEIVGDALALGVEDREAFLDRVCRDANGKPNPSLRGTAAGLLAASDEADRAGALKSPVSGIVAQFAEDASMPEGAIPGNIGPWRVVRRLGSGGMGVVFEAVRDEPTFQQRAAVKVVHPAFAADFQEQFLRERALLARLDHAGVARLLDGGRAADGTPYLAMELVEGEPITKFANALRLDVEGRLRLFLQACDAVAYAHRNLVVHRDLKPGHVLVRETADGAYVKLLDFGVAKLLATRDDQATHTLGGPLTAAYAAPEQFRAEAVTTATDVYALGLVLYELLVGRRAYDISGLTASERERVVAQFDPPAPSSVAADLRLQRAIGRDLDQVVLKAISKDPRRRYASADALADDLHRYLAGQPVVAQPDSLAYRVHKFAGRNRRSVAGGLLFLAVLTVAIVMFTARLATERNRARRAAAAAIESAERAQAVSDFLERVLRAPNDRWYVKGQAKGPDTPIADVLAEAAAQVEKDFADRPEIRADLHHILGDTYLSLGMTEETRYHHETTLAIREEIYKPPHPKLAEALYYAAMVKSSEGESLQLLRQAVRMQMRRNEGNNFPFLVQSLVPREIALNNLAFVDTLTLAAYRFADRNFVVGSRTESYRPSLARIAADRSWVLVARGDLDEARAWLQRADSLLYALPDTGLFFNVWYQNLMSHGIYAAAVGQNEEADRIFRAYADQDYESFAPAPFDAPRRMEFDSPSRWWAASRLVELREATGADVPDRFREMAGRHRQRVNELAQAIVALDRREQ